MRTVACGMLLGLGSVLGVFHWPAAAQRNGNAVGIPSTRTGWKGRGIWATYSSYMPKFTETRAGNIEHIQLRPNPLAN